MICDECGIRPATIRLMSIVDGEKTARNLCAHCLADVKKTLPNLDLSGLDGMLASLMAATKKMGAREQQEEISITCPSCGTTYATFQQSGMLGCAGCYDAFRQPLEQLLKRIHGQTQHTGRTPDASAPDISAKISIYNLKQQLTKAIAAEEYEQAALLRDRIRALSAQAPEKEVRMHDGV